MADELFALGGGGWIGYIVVAITGGILAFRHLVRKDTVSGANAQASVDAITRLYDLLDAERRDKAELQILLKEANLRVDQANKERNVVILQIGDIKAQLAALESEVRLLRREKGYDQQD